MVSIIVPVYRVEPYIHDCLTSILQQTFSNFELILVDDGSPDASGQICDEIAADDNRVIVIHKENGGVSSARNEGLCRASGDFVLFIDSDDWVHHDFVDVLCSSAKENAADLTICDYIIRPNDKNEKLPRNNIALGNLSEDGISDLFKTHAIFAPFCKLYRNDIIRKYNILFDTSISFGEDLLFNLEYLRHVDRISMIDLQLYNYRQVDGSLVRSFSQKKIYDFVCICKQLLNFLVEYNLMNEQVLRQLINYVFRDYLIFLNNIMDSKYSLRAKFHAFRTLNELYFIKMHKSTYLTNIKSQSNIAFDLAVRLNSFVVWFVYLKLKKLDIWRAHEKGLLTWILGRKFGR